MKIDHKKAKLIKERTEHRYSLDSENQKGSVRADLNYIDGMKIQSKIKEFTLTIDESDESGGNDNGPNPLSYFLTGACSCLMIQYLRLAIINEFNIKKLNITARGHFEMKVKGVFNKIIYDIYLISDEKPEKIKNIAGEAEDLCFIHNTLIKAGVKMETNLHLNGKLLIF